MATMRLGTQLRNSLADTIARLIDAGGAEGKLQFYTGPQPPTAQTPVDGQILLGTLRFSYPCADEAGIGVLSFKPIAEASSAEASGKVSWARIANSNDEPVFDCDAGGPGTGAVIELNTDQIVKGGPIRVTTFTMSVPERS